MRIIILRFILLLFFILACNNIKSDVKQIDLGIIEDNRLKEISGIDKSAVNKDIFWIHNDSGNLAQIFAIDGKGNHIGRFKLTGIKNRDWEDITVGSGPDSGQSYIYLGEIGDNEAIYNLKYIYRIKEPYIDLNKIPYDQALNDIEIITYQYPDGARDAETLMIDPLTKDLIVTSKREESVHVYVLPYPQSTNSIITPELVVTLPITQVTAGDISDSGTKIVLKNYEEIYFWQRRTNQSLEDIFINLPKHLPYIPEPQGEAICWSEDEKGYLTVSEEVENIEARLYYYIID
jgi:hypothetical protein